MSEENRTNSFFDDPNFENDSKREPKGKDELNRYSDSLVEADNPYQSSRNADGTSNPSKKDAEEAEADSKAEKTETENDKDSETSSEKPKAKKKSGGAKEVIRKIVLVIAIITFIGSASVLGLWYYNVSNNKKQADTLAGSINTSVPDDAVGADGILEKYRPLYEQNNDFVGWITVPGTAINHPVVQAADNNFYLRKNFSKQYERRGTVFMDYRDHVDKLCKNTILYGHNYVDSTMFSDLEKYEDIEFYKQNPVIEFNTLYKNYKWKVICVFYSNAEDKDDNGYTLNYIYPFMTNDSFMEYMTELYTRTLYYTPVDVEPSDKILTLSTCTRNMDIKGHGETNARFVVVARLVREGENVNVNTAEALVNENPKQPQIWYDAHGTQNPYVDAKRWYPEGVEY